MPSTMRKRAARAAASSRGPQLIHRPKHKPTSEIILTKKLSFELVRTVVTVTISDIVYRRSLFPADKFCKRPYDPVNPTCLDYDSFMAGPNGKPLEYEPSDGVINFVVLSRDHHPAAKKILDWLEIGVKDALEKECLSKLELTFHQADGSQVSDDNLIESYAMVFTYGADGGVTTISTGDSTQVVGSAVLQTAKQDAVNLMYAVDKQMARVQQYGLEDLPTRVRVNMNMLFNDKCPPDYHPPLFCQSEDSNTRLINLRSAPRLFRMENGFHSISVHLDENRAPQNPFESCQSSLSPHLTGHVEEECVQASDETVEDTTLTTCSSGHSFHNRIYTEDAGTQPKAMNMLSSVGLSRNPDGDTQDTLMLHTLSAHSLSSKLTPHQALDHCQASNNSRRHNTDVCEKIDQVAKKDVLEFAQRLVTGNKVKCECEVNTDETNLMECGMCGHSQHTQCYGYYEPKPQGVKWICYTCLSQNENDPNLLSKMKTLCIERRLLHHLCISGEQSVEQVARSLTLDISTTNDILERLKKYVQRTQRPKRNSSYQQIPQRRYTLIGDEEELRQEFFNPNLHIHGQLSSTDSGETPTFTPTSFGIDSSLHALPGHCEPLHPLQGSSTQGTPSPAFDRRRPSIHSKTPKNAQLTEQTYAGAKRGALAALQNDKSKRFRGYSSHSPQIIENSYRVGF